MNCKKILSIPIVLSLLLLVAATAHIFYPPLNNWKLLLEGKKNTYTLFQPLGSIDEMGEDFSARTNLRFAETAMTGPQVLPQKRYSVLQLPQRAYSRVYFESGAYICYLSFHGIRILQLSHL